MKHSDIIKSVNCIKGTTINVDLFKTNTNTDDEAINIALSKIETNGTIEFSNRVYEISKPINISNKQISLIGKGGNSTQIKAITNMETMVITSNETGFHGHNIISGIVFDTNNLARSCIDASYSRYMTIENNHFIAENANHILKIGCWVNRILNNKFVSNKIAYGLVLTSDTNNNTIISQNSFSSCKIGIKGETGGNSVIIEKNSFDFCKDTGILFQIGARHLVIRDNYFEGCGLESTTTVQTGESTYENWEGAIICHTGYNVLTYTFNNLTIENNMFANCNKNNTLTLSNLRSCYINNNTLHNLYKCENFINLKGYALGENKNAGFYYNHINTHNCVTKILSLNTIRNREYTNNITTDLEKIYLDTELENYTQATPGTPLNIVKKNDFDEYYELTSSDNTSRIIEKEFTIQGDVTDKNIQIEYETKGKNKASGVWFTLFINNTEVESIQKTGEDWFKVSCMYPIPVGSNTIKLRLRSLSATDVCMIKKFKVSIF